MHDPDTPRALVLLAPGSEEMEVVITVDVLRRADVDVTLASVRGVDPIRCSRGVRLVPDAPLAEMTERVFDCVVVPGGGGGTEVLAAEETVRDLLQTQWNKGRCIAAICAGPAVLVRAGVGAGERMTSHPAVRDEVARFTTYSEEPVVTSGNLITSRGPGTAFKFALRIVTTLQGSQAAETVSAPMMLL